VNGRSEKGLELKTRDDLFYIQNYSPWLDLYILVRTPWIVLKGEGAF
jgi:lipopolysaccharide/colanic/teichoic acid biosynthesis glycosyltransferase